MPRPDTRSAALSRLFGGQERHPDPSDAENRDADRADEAAPAANTSGALEAVPARRSSPKTQEATTRAVKPLPTADAETAVDKKTSTGDAKPTTNARTRKRTNKGRGTSRAKAPEVSKSARNAAERTQSDQEAGASGYIGSGRYRRSSGVMERIAPYVRPDQAEALRIACALRNDPRGTDLSAIIQSLLDEAGYHGDT